MTSVRSAPERLAQARAALLLVDDDPLIAEALTFALGAEYAVHACASRAAAIELVRRLEAPPPLALVDLGLPPTPHAPDEGFQLIADLLAHAPQMKILVLSGQNDAANARHARALGAWEFVAKPSDPAHLKRMLSRALAAPAGGDVALIGESPALAKLKSQLAQFAPAPYPVLIEGESGSGKEMAARSLHRLSPRAQRPYLTLNCAAIAPTLVEPTLFGYVKGAFTGAAGNKSGYFEDAGDGTLLLDEIGELPLDLQAKLLRVLENGEYQRVGETQRRTARCRVIAATNRDLRREMKKGGFRADLYHRLSVFTLGVPPLREMEQDKLALLEHFRKLSPDKPFELDEAATARWLRYGFPGNVRELRNIVIRLGTKYPGQRLSVAELEPELDLESPAPTAGTDGGAIVEQALRQLERSGGFNLDEMLKNWERGY
ncbi:MAG TPA: sigma-54 dependent transcriptional regulator, partial [Burkholderiales bacterium]|nr:sigma-54 dependent transcriptional regulator [Burkholderiales bacterium]